MSDVIDEIKLKLTGAGIRVPIVAYAFQPQAGTQICIIPGGGHADFCLGGDAIKYIRVQIQVRSQDLQTAESTIYQILSTLFATELLTIGGIRWDGRTPDYWMADDGYHVMAAEFVVIR